MFFDTFTQQLVMQDGDKDLYSLHEETGLPLNETSRLVYTSEKLERKSVVDDVLNAPSFPLSDTTYKDTPFYAWMVECRNRLSSPGTSFSRPWVFQADLDCPVASQVSTLLRFHDLLKIQPYIITEDMLQESIAINTLLVNKGVVCVVQKEKQGPRYKAFSSPLFTKGGECDILCTYTQSVVTVKRSYIIIGITNNSHPSAIQLAEVFPSLHDWQHALTAKKDQ